MNDKYTFNSKHCCIDNKVTTLVQHCKTNSFTFSILTAYPKHLSSSYRF